MLEQWLNTVQQEISVYTGLKEVTSQEESRERLSSLLKSQIMAQV